MTIFSTFPPRFTLLKINTAQCHPIIGADESALLRTNVHWLELKWDTARFPERSEGPATYRTRSCRSHEKQETQSNSANKCTINFIRVCVYMHYKKLNYFLLHDYTDLGKGQIVML